MSGAIYITFKEKGIENAKQAVQEDEAGNYDKALQLYLASLEYFKTYLKYEKNPKVREAITDKVRAPAPCLLLRLSRVHSSHACSSRTTLLERNTSREWQGRTMAGGLRTLQLRRRSRSQGRGKTT